MASSRLDEIVENKQLEVAQRRKVRATQYLEELVLPAQGRFLRAIANHKGANLNLIAEVKPKSPSLGVLRSELSLDAVIAAYDKYAAGISVLTDQKYFGGSLELLQQTAARSSRPLLCKDFIIDRHQCFEARLCGAEAVLLIVKILTPGTLQELHQTITNLGMTAVVEVQTEEEMASALVLEPSIVLVNNRNLQTFAIDLNTTARLAAMVPKTVTLVSASGIERREDIDRLLPYCHTFLIGSSLMRAGDIEAKLLELSLPVSIAGES